MQMPVQGLTFQQQVDPLLFQMGDKDGIVMSPDAIPATFNRCVVLG
jgi:hypothetical protein